MNPPPPTTDDALYAELLGEKQQGTRVRELYSVRESARALCSSIWKIYNLLNAGRLDGVKVGHCVRVTRVSLLAYLAAQAQYAPAFRLRCLVAACDGLPDIELSKLRDAVQRKIQMRA